MNPSSPPEYPKLYNYSKKNIKYSGNPTGKFRTIILGHCIIVYTDHKNLTFENFTTERVLSWHLTLEEYIPGIKYTKGSDNDAADALSRLQLINYGEEERDVTREYLAERYCVKKNR